MSVRVAGLAMALKSACGQGREVKGAWQVLMQESVGLLRRGALFQPG
jgi:hypothetical protein